MFCFLTRDRGSLRLVSRSAEFVNVCENISMAGVWRIGGVAMLAKQRFHTQCSLRSRCSSFNCLSFVNSRFIKKKLLLEVHWCAVSKIDYLRKEHRNIRISLTAPNNLTQ